MSLEYSIKVDSNEPVIRAELDKDIERALYAIGVKAVEGAVRSISGQYTPSNQAVDTGRLRASISFITAGGDSGAGAAQVPESKSGDRLSGKAEANTVVIGSNTSYAEFVHNGTHKMRARPFLREGIDNTKSEMEEIVKDIFEGSGEY